MEHKYNFTSQVPKLSMNECTEIIKKKLNTSDFKIISFNLVGLNTVNGFLGEHRRLIITIVRNNEKLEETKEFCFAKFLPENQAQIDFVITCGVFKKEVFVYEELFPKFKNYGIDDLQTVVPDCYYIKEDFVLVFEDVCKKGFKPLSKFGYLDYNHVLVTLISMAKLHAASLIYEEKMSTIQNKPYRLLDDYEHYFYETFYVDNPKHKGGQGVHAALKGLYTGLTLYPEHNYDMHNEQFKANIRKACLDIFELVKPSKKYRNCICHGDLWSTNIMIQYDNKKPISCLILDFQTLRYCPPAHDFMSFMHLTTTTEFRKEHLKNLQQIYYDALGTLLRKYEYNIKTVVPFEEFLQSCEEQKRFAVIQTVQYVQLTQVKDTWIAEYIKNEELWNQALYVDRSQMVIENCKNDPEYRAVFGEALKNLKEICDVK